MCLTQFKYFIKLNYSLFTKRSNKIGLSMVWWRDTVPGKIELERNEIGLDTQEWCVEEEFRIKDIHK